MFMCVVNQKSVNKLDLTWKQSFLIILMRQTRQAVHAMGQHALKNVNNCENIKIYFYLVTSSG